MTSGVTVTKEHFLEIIREKHSGTIESLEFENWSKNAKFYCNVCCNTFSSLAKHIAKQQGCPFCEGRRKNLQIVIQESDKIYGNKFDYSKTVFVNTTKKFKVICNDCGNEVETNYNYHIRKAVGCKYCRGMCDDYSKIFIERANLVHNNLYDYSLVDYVNSQTKIKIICLKHQKEFTQLPHNHLGGATCPVCAQEKEMLIKRILKKFLCKKQRVYTVINIVTTTLFT